MAERSRKWRAAGKITVAAIAGMLLFVALPEAGRWVNGGALAQQMLNGLYGNSNAVTGATIVGNGQGGTAANVTTTGTPGQTTVGADINATGCAGQNVTGLRVIQNGPGTGLNVTVNGNGGSTTGMQVTVGSRPCN
jgi:hypothetical protein